MLLDRTLAAASAVGVGTEAPQGEYGHTDGTGPVLGRAVVEDIGAVYAGTEPFIGVTINYTYHSKLQLTAAACAPLAASIHRHTFWFKGKSYGKGSPPHEVTEQYESNQQEAEQDFMSRISSELCANPAQTDDEYTTILHAMLAKVRVHINRHVHSAFWVKASCSILDECYDVSVKVDNDPKSGLATSLMPQIVKEPNGCVNTVMEHEKYNLAEGFTFVNIQYTLLSAGAQFCTAPDFNATLAQWEQDLESTMIYHASNHAFEEMLDSHLAQLCTLPEEYEGQYADVFTTVADQIDADVLADEQSCTMTESEFARMPFLTSNPPSPLDIVTIIEQNTQLTANAAAGAARNVLSLEGCIDPATHEVDAATSAELLHDLNAHVEAHSPAWVLRLGNVTADPQSFHLSLGSVYHKVLTMCYPGGGDTTYSGVCMSSQGELVQSSLSDGATQETNPVFDLVTAADITQCSGEACKAAARAVLAYQELLGSVTVLRWDTIRTATGGTTELPAYDQQTWTWSRSCPALRAIVDNFAVVSQRLPGVIDALRVSAPQLETSCVSPRRDIASVGRATLKLGEEKAAANAEVWDHVLLNLTKSICRPITI